MEIQSISIVVPTPRCVNNCPFCVSRMHSSFYKNTFDKFQIKKRIKYAVAHRVTTCVITGTGEALQNKKFLEQLALIFEELDHPFPNIELQTTGVMLMESDSASMNQYSLELLKRLGVNTISVSVSDIFEPAKNWSIIDAPISLRRSFIQLFSTIKQNGFNLRLSLNMTSVYNDKYPEDILIRCQELGADQITFRKLYGGGENTPESIWVDENMCKDTVIDHINEYITGCKENRKFNRGEGRPGYKLPFGAWVYSINGMSVAIDDDCMAKETNENLKYVILRENGKLYWAWDDEGSIIF